jgi:hypothetical protein
MQASAYIAELQRNGTPANGEVRIPPAIEEALRLAEGRG